MDDFRIKKHPILKESTAKYVDIYFDGKKIRAKQGEMLSSALFAAGIRIFGHHDRDGGAQGIFCANGQCSKCTVIIDGKPVKSCMIPVRNGMNVYPAEGLPELKDDGVQVGVKKPVPELTETMVLIIGGGPAGLNAALELGQCGIEVLVIDDKSELGGKLSLQTHNFFGSVSDCYAGKRGIDIGHILEDKVRSNPNIKIWQNSTVVGVYADKTFGVSSRGNYRIVKPEVVLNSTGAREKTLVFPGSDLPGVYGAGAFQTLVNRDLIRSSEKLFVIGGGNVGVIAAYHALQAGIDVLGIVEALDKCGAYKVHVDKIKRLGVPVWTSHSVVRCEGEEQVQKITISQIDENFQPLSGTEKSFEVDTVLVAVGLAPVDELLEKSRNFGIEIWAAGDAEEIAEASAAIFSGKITGRKIAQSLGKDISIPDEWEPLANLLKSRPGKYYPNRPDNYGLKATYNLFGKTLYAQNPASGETVSMRILEDMGITLPPGNKWLEARDLIKAYKIAPVQINEDYSNLQVYPVIHCDQEIPCNPCHMACPLGSISINGDIMNLPEFHGKCMGCGKCVMVCPGLAITLVYNNYESDEGLGLIMLPFEFDESLVPKDGIMELAGNEGEVLGKGKVIEIIYTPKQNGRKLIKVEVPWSLREKVVGVRIRIPGTGEIENSVGKNIDDDPIVCLCERVRKSEIVAEIRKGVRDMNQLKATIRAGMGSCGGKTCSEQVLRVFREEGIDPSEVTPPTIRPFVAEVHLGDFLGKEDGEEE